MLYSCNDNGVCYILVMVMEMLYNGNDVVVSEGGSSWY